MLMPRHRILAKPPMRFALLALGLVAACPQVQADEATGIAHFETKIRPLLAEHCYQCHSAEAKKLKANLYLDSRPGWQTGGDSGPAIEPGKPDDSLLIQAISHTNGDLKMPPKTRLSMAEIEALRSWIAMGAPDPRDGEVNHSFTEIDLEKGREFWSFQPPIVRPVPEVKDTSWPVNDIDRFILARLEAESLPPAKDAPRRTLLRRIYYDFIGLPPSPKKMSEFLSDSSPAAFEKVVDDLLARPEFGERWGRHWLDVSRFAESSGGGRSLVFPDAWRFRDYVIDSLNRDKPYDDFVREQLAGDVLEYRSIEQRNEQLIASGYLVIGAINYELQDKELLRMEFVDEQIDALGRTFLGMTLGCARCHDHKFDPIPTTDYYALAGIFQSTESMGKGSAASGVVAFTTAKLEVSDTEEISQHRDTLETVSNKIADLKKQLGKNRTSGSIAADSVPGTVVDSTSAKLTGHWMPSVHSGAWIGDGYIHDEGKLKGQKQVEFSASLTESRDYEVLVAYSASGNRSKNTPVTISHAEGETTVVIDQTKTATLHRCFVSVGIFPFIKGTPARVTISNHDTSGVVIADAVSFAEPAAAKTPEKITVDRDKAEADLKELEKQRKSIQKNLAKLEPVAMAAAESDSPADGHVHIRGQVRNKGELIPRGFISVAMSPGATPQIDDDSSGRLELANWIANAENPLTSRVLVNRVWKHLLGEGIVRTPDNFGQTGELPSHPELLDHLAIQFVNDGWSIKNLIREVVHSRTYQLSSQVDHNRDFDMENRLFGRAHRKRLEAESIRDTALLVSGQLDFERGGLTIRNPGQYDMNYQFDTKRRSVYVPWFRNSILGLFEVFDAANPNLVIGKRTTTNLPTQALFLMNSPFIREQSELTAKRLIEENASIEHAYELILGRPPTATERTSTDTFLHQFAEDDQLEAWSQVCQTLFSCLDFRFLD